MKRLIVLLLGSILVMVPLVAGAFPPDMATGKNCSDCHKLDKKEADVLLKKLNPAISVLEVRISPVKGLWQIEVDAGEGKRGALLLDYAKKHFIVLSQLIPLDTLGQIRKIDFSKLPLKDAMVLGTKGAKRKVAVFSDPECPYCKKLHDEIKLVLGKRKDIAFYLFLYPLPMHKDAYKKSQSVLCDKSADLLDDAFSGKSVPEPKCGNERVEKNLSLGKDLSINATPTIIREDGTVLSAFLPADKLIEWIEGK